MGPELVKIIMLTLPYLLAYSPSGFEQKAAEILGKTEIIASAPSSAESFVNPYMPSDEDGNPSTQNILSLLQKQLQNEAEKQWTLAFMPRPFKPQAAETDGAAEGNDASPEDAAPQKHAFPTITVPQTVNAGPKPLFPEVFFSMYADQDIEVCTPSPSSYLRV